MCAFVCPSSVWWVDQVRVGFELRSDLAVAVAPAPLSEDAADDRKFFRDRDQSLASLLALERI